ncbi:corticosteroid- binding protein [Desmophyllum pertusum]|uniref:Corticosteroid- binding protein n=1 Tax=Desmophyllum pertusum TaxID=174260 RepID=A0A9W9ZAA1_9CNID|nr:corticosteroid- binding protein [Desmophyllum pertusum]
MLLRRKNCTAFCQSLVFLAFLISVETSLEKRQTYNGDQVLQVTPRTEKDVKFMGDLLHKRNNFELDFWTYPSQPGKPVDIRVRHDRMRQFKHALKRRSLSFRVKIRSLQRLINKEGMRPRSVPFNGAFRTYFQIVREMKRLAGLNESLAKVFSLGKTYENRTMYGIKISSNISTSRKSVVFINCGIHAREWISISSCVYVARELVLKYATDDSVRHLVDKLEWVIVPVVNVDGYIYTHTTRRLWRKNRRPSSTECVGTDLNRNFNYKWASIGADYGKPCSDIYPGQRPFSEPETRHLATYMYSIRGRIKAYVDFHAYGQLWMSPWGFTRKLPPTYTKHNWRAMTRIVRSIYYINGTVFGYGPAAIAIYYTSGDATDWVYGVLGVTHSYGVELQPSFYSENGFVLPPSYIVPVAFGVKSVLFIFAYAVQRNQRPEIFLQNTSSGQHEGCTEFAFVLLFASVFCEPESYKGHKVYRVFPKNIDDLKVLDKLLKAGHDGIDFWTYPTEPLNVVDIRVAPAAVQKLEGILNNASISFKVGPDDVQKILQNEKGSARAGGFDGSYHKLGEIHSEIRSLANKHSSVASIISLGKSYENRDQLAIKIKSGSGKKDLFFFNCGIHAREWISPATCMYMIRQILETRNSDSGVKYMLDNYEWVILPVLNVDGYEYTHTNYRMWRKTRSRNSDGSYGADPNRNFNYHFAGVGTSQSQSSDIYTGSRPFSEKVTHNVGKYLYGRRAELKGYIDFHAYSQMWMSPWGYTRSKPPHINEMMKAMKAAVDALRAVHGTRYTYGPAATTIYPTTGDTTDWTFGVLGVIHSYCVELRPRSSSQGGFVLPPDKIIPVGEETFAGLKALTMNM